MPDDGVLALVAIGAVLMWEAARRLMGPMFEAILLHAARTREQRNERLAVERVLLECNYSPTDPPEQQARILRQVAETIDWCWGPHD